jgi:flavodoxin
MKVLVAYMSQSGNTRRVAEAIYEQIKADKEIRQLADIADLEGYDLVFFGFPIQAYGPAHPAREFLGQHSTGKNIALFVTHAASEDQEELPGWLAKCREAATGANIMGMFDCRGELSQSTADLMLKSGDPKLVAWAQERSETIGQPDAARLERARAFAGEVMNGYSASDR